MSTLIPFSDQFDDHSAWRREFAIQLKSLSQWIVDNDLLDAGIQAQLIRLEQLLRTDKVVVAFVAEFSRGKSELINALFFANYGRRIMPASAGRTTMCPTELGYEPNLSPCLRLLPVQTKLQALSLMEWREKQEEWTRIDLDLQDPDRLAVAFEKVAEVIRVTQDEAAALGFWNENNPDDASLVDSNGMVEVPRWRHAIVNIEHPLLKQGLVILDTPGLNAVGAEPELTISLLPQAHAILFVLAADTGVTKSDLQMWREHLGSQLNAQTTRLVVLNKIDTLWDTLSTQSQVDAQIERQRQTSADILGVAPAQVIAVSAQKGLVAKISQDDDLLQLSQLPQLEEVLAKHIVGRRRLILRHAVSRWAQSLHHDAARIFGMRRRDLAEQTLELKSLRGKNSSVIQSMRKRIEQEQSEFDQHYNQIQAVKFVHRKLQKQLHIELSNSNVKMVLQALMDELAQPGLKLGARKAYERTFHEIRQLFSNAAAVAADLGAMLEASFRQLNAQSGFSLQAPNTPDMTPFHEELDQLEATHMQYLTLGNALKLVQASYRERLVRLLHARLRIIFEEASREFEQWSKNALAQIDAQVLERRKGFIHRLDAIDRIREAAANLNERIHEIEKNDQKIAQQESQLEELTQRLLGSIGSEAESSVAIDIVL